MVSFLLLLLPSTVTKIAVDMRETAQMTLKIERHADGQKTTLRLVGHMQAEHKVSWGFNMAHVLQARRFG